MKEDLRESNQEFRRLQNEIATLRDRNAALREGGTSLQSKLDEKEKRIKTLRAAKDRAHDDYESLLKNLRAQKKLLEECVEEQNQTMMVGNKCLRDKAGLAKQLEAEFEDLKFKLDDKEAQVQNLTAQLFGIASAAAPQLVQIALNIQATQTLGVIDGLQAEIVQKDALILSLREEQAETLKHEASMAANRRMEEKKTAMSEADRVMEKAIADAARVMRELEKERGKAGELRKVAEEQQVLIGKLMEGNARLSGLGAGG